MYSLLAAVALVLDGDSCDAGHLPNMWQPNKLEIRLNSM